MTAGPPPFSFEVLEELMEKRKIGDEADALACLAAAKKSGLTLTGWGRNVGVDGRSLRAWSINLARGAAGQRRGKASHALTKRVELVELIAAPSAPVHPTPRYTVRVGKVGIELGDDFDAGTIRRLVAALAAC